MLNNRGAEQLELWGSETHDSPRQETMFSRFDLETISPSRHRPTSSTATPTSTSSVLDSSFALRRPLNILVADDNAINRKVIRVILQKLGYHCVEATNGEEALEQYHSGEYDYIFMDLDMPEMDGIEAAQAIREIEKDPKTGRGSHAQDTRPVEIIAVTANVSDETRKRCRRAGMNGYLEKPINATMIKNQLLRSWPRIRSRRSK